MKNDNWDDGNIFLKVVIGIEVFLFKIVEKEFVLYYEFL